MLTGAADPLHHRDYIYCEYYNAWTHPRSYGTMMRTPDKKIAVYHGVDEGELYDLAADPDEFANLWSSSDHAAMRQLALHALDQRFALFLDVAEVRELARQADDHVHGRDEPASAAASAR